MKIFLNRILFSILLLFLFSCDDQVNNIEIITEVPVSVKQGDVFDIFFKIKNISGKPQELVSIDIEQEYLEGFAILQSSPFFNDSFHIPLFNMQSYSFNESIGAYSEIIIIFSVKAIGKGYYKGNIDFPINSEMSFITRPIFTEIY